MIRWGRRTWICMTTTQLTRKYKQACHPEQESVIHSQTYVDKIFNKDYQKVIIISQIGHKFMD